MRFCKCLALVAVALAGSTAIATAASNHQDDGCTTGHGYSHTVSEGDRGAVAEKIAAVSKRSLGIGSLSAPLLGHVDSGDIWKIGALAAGLLLLLGVWRWQLKRTVANRTSTLQNEIEERDRVELSLRDSEKSYREVFDTISDAVFIHGPSGAILDVNQTMLDMFGYTHDEVVNVTVEELSSGEPPYSHREANEYIQRAVTEGPQTFEWLSRRKNGELFWTEVILASSQICGQERILAVVRDITERKQASETIKAERDKLQALVDGLARAGIGVDIVSTNHEILFQNDVLQAQFGDPAGHCCYKHYRGLPEPCDPCPMQQAIAENEVKGIELTASDGRDYEILSVPLANADGSVERAIELIQDITERKRAQARLQESESKLRAIFDQTFQLMGLLSTEGTLLEINSTALEFVGVDAAEVIGKPFWETAWWQHSPREQERVREAVARAASGEFVRYETTNRDRSGAIRAFDFSLKPILNAEGEVIYLNPEGRDITEYREAERTVEENERKFRTLVENIPGMVYRCRNDADWTMVYLSDSARELIGYPASQFINNCRRSFASIIHPDDRESVWQHVNGCMEKAVPYTLEYRIVRPDGAVRWVHEKGRGVNDPQGEVVYLDGVIFDITRRKEAEQDLQGALVEVRKLKDQIAAENVQLRNEIRMAHLHGDILAQSDIMKGVMAQAEQVAPTDSTVLILGETGTGKELLARAIHQMSTRKDRPLVTVNCAAIPSTLIESQLFGREKGAYTGAVTKQVGHFEIADGATLFLDEVAELPLDVQAKLLRALQEGEIQRLGSPRAISVDARVIAATNRDLAHEVEAGRFRQDLFYRLNVFPVTVPPLRDRQDDVEPLIWTFVNEFAEKMGKRIESIPAKSMQILRQYRWPGNIRELRNTIERAVILTSAKTLQLPAMGQTTDKEQKWQALSAVERAYMVKVLDHTGWRIRGKGGAAEILDLKPTTLETRMAKLAIKRPDSSSNNNDPSSM